MPYRGESGYFDFRARRDFRLGAKRRLDLLLDDGLWTEEDAELVSSASHPAPYGKGSDTVIDSAVRNTRELDTAQFELTNPKWAMALEAVVRNVATELDVSGGAASVKAVLYKMLLYGKGAMFKEHREYVCPTDEKPSQSLLTSCVL